MRKAAVATLAPHPEQRARFDALFDLHFLGAVGEPGEDEWQADDDMQVQDDIGTEEVVIGEEVNETGQAATGAEALAIRALRAPDDAQTLRRFADALPDSLPRRRGYRHKAARRGKGIDLARSLRAAMRNEGEVMSLKTAAARDAPPPHSSPDRRVRLDEGSAATRISRWRMKSSMRCRASKFSHSARG